MSIRTIKIRLFKLQDDDKKAKELKSKKLLEGWKDIKKVFYFQDFLYFLKVIGFKLINKYHNYLLAGYFKIKKCKS